MSEVSQRGSLRPTRRPFPNDFDRPDIYNRRWHLDENARRHHGKRRWDPATLDALLTRLSTLDLYPPDFSHPDRIRLRACGASKPIATIETHLRSVVRLRLQSTSYDLVSPSDLDAKALAGHLRRLETSRALGRPSGKRSEA
jgi:hypothetical protein